ncbi:MAG: hypothetical protein LW855_02140 [Alphaproteobacteria bacterium]|nr:hypothetical protein [Thalassospira sp.]MCE2964577.1 hypothetical protein [Alphaproteobacteria bacterium]
MPHLILEHAAPLAERLDIPAVLKQLHETLCAQPTVGAKDVKSRSVPSLLYYTGENPKPESLFAHVEVRLLEGRSWAEISVIQQAVVAALKKNLPDEVVRTVEIREMRRAFYYKE